MTSLFQKLAALSPEQRALFEQKLVERGLRSLQRTGIPKRQTSEPPPLSFAQQRLWFIQQLDPTNTAYNVVSVLRLRGALDISVLEQTLNALIERHETLRTSFDTTADNQPIQVVHQFHPVTLPVIDLRQSDQADDPDTWINTLTQEPFNLTQPLLRLALLQLDDQDFLLVLTAHHIICDRWSVMVFLREMTGLYHAFQQEQPSPLTPLLIQYGDWAIWQRQQLQRETLETQVAYWQERLGGELPVLELPCDRPHPAVPSYRGAQYPLALSLELSTALKTLSAQSNTTLFTLLLTAFKVLLHRYSDQDDILVGSDIANRDRTETEGLIGLLVNTLVLRSDLSGDPRFCDLLSRVQEGVLGALAHQDLPFEKLVEALNPDRRLSQMMPIFQAKLDLQQVRLQPLDLPGITLERYPLKDNQAKYELRFNLQDTEQGISGQVEYSIDLFDEDTIERMVKHFTVLLAGIVADPTSRLSDLPLLTEAEQHTLLTTWNENQMSFPGDRCIHQLFEAQVEHTPEITALIWGDQRFTYRELEHRANRLANYLQSLGIGPEVPVGICMERSANLVISLLATLKAGGAYVPLDPAYPAERLAFIVADAHISVLLMDGDVPFEVRDQPLVKVNAPSIIETYGSEGHAASSLNSDHDFGLEAPSDGLNGKKPGMSGSAYSADDIVMRSNVRRSATSDCLAYVIYTSGSTGRPKGVAVEHRNAVAMLHWAKHQFSPSELAGVLASTSICFDLSVFELFAPLSWGGCVILAENALALPKLSAAEAVTLVNAVPSAMAALIDLGGLPSSVKTINLAGEALPPSLVNKLQLLPHIQHIYNLYGPSEDTTYSTWADVSQLDTAAHRAPIGKPIANTQAYVCDRHGNPVPIGIPGELYLSGMGVARGYLNRPDLTVERFVPNPFWEGRRQKAEGRISPHPPIPPSTLYRTGDRVRYRPNGSLEFLGRFDHQVKIRGFRIETGEIEAVLNQHPAVKEAVVVAWEEDQDGQLVAYVVGKAEEKAEGRRQKVEEEGNREQGIGNRSDGVMELGSDDFRTFLSSKLPDYMLPVAFAFLESLPRLPNGKVDRRSLPKPNGLQRDTFTLFVAPRTAVERALEDIWRRELKLAQVSVHDNFFELGGHSLLGIRMMAQVEQALEQNIPLKALFQTPTIAGLTAHLEQMASEKPDSGAAVASRLPMLMLDPDSRYEPFPLTDIQQAYLLGRSRAFELGNVATHGYREIETVGLSVAQVERALRSQIERHDMLRVVVTPDGQQRILPEVPPYEIRVRDLRRVSLEQRETELAAMRNRLSHQIHDVGQWPLFTIEAAQLTEDRARFFVGFDVLIGDAWSFQLLGWELAQSLQGKPLPPLGLTFRDYVLAEQAFQQSPDFQQAWDYWQGRLPKLPPAPELPLAVAPGSIEQPQFERRSDRLTATAWQCVKQRANQVGLTPSGVLLAAFAEVLAAWSRNPCFTLNLTLFNRLPLHPEVNQIVGDFTSSLLLAVDNSGDDSFVTRARRLQAQLWEDLEHRAVSGVQVLRELMHTQQRAGAALMPVVFTSTLNQTRPVASDRPWQTEVVYGLSQTSQVYLDHQVSEIEGELVFNWDAIADLFPTGMLDDMFQAYGQFLRQLAEADAVWETPPRLSPTAHVEVLNATAMQLFVGPEPLLHTLFLDQAQKQPNHPAIIAGDITLTYRELRQRILPLAHHLRQLGVQPNQLVAVSMEKGWEPVVAVLAILTAGAAYVPIDPTLPQSRRWHLIRETEATILLSQPHLDHVDWPDSLTLINIEANPSALGSLFDLAHDELSSASPKPTDLAYVIYTSGSTGNPKGVMIDHRGAVNTVLDINRRFAINASDRILALSALSFDLSVYDIFGTLAAGATVVMPAPQEEHDPAHWVNLLNTHAVTLWNSVPALMQLLLTELASHAATHADSLRLILLSGDWLPLHLPNQIRSQFSKAKIISLGGATEASIWSIAYPIEAIDSTWKSIPYGRPLANQQWYVLNENLQPCPVWVPGQLYVGGKGLAKGYWRQPGKTAEAFVPNPFFEGRRQKAEGRRQEKKQKAEGRRRNPSFSPLTPPPTHHPTTPLPHYPTTPSSLSASPRPRIPGSPPPPSLYKTGDLGRYRLDGSIEFLGREDFQVKLNGYRIELGEIEVALLQHPMIREAVVAAVGETSQNQQLVAYLVPKGSEKADGSEATLNHPLAKLEFKQQCHGLRTFSESPDSVALPLPETDPQPYLRRRSYRQFLDSPIGLAAFSQFLSGLKSIQLETSPLPKHRYASAGSLYPVQTYLYIKPQRVEGITAGFYYYNPAEHWLIRLEPTNLSEQDVNNDALYGSNREIAGQGAFVLFLIGQMEAIAPLYPENARDFCLLEAGYMSQLLMETAPDFNLGLCPLGKLGVEPLQRALDLDASHQLLHGLAGGAIDPAWTHQLQPPEMPRSAPSMADSIGQFLRQKLPAYMIPTTYHLLDRLPLSANGKVDRKALPIPNDLLNREVPFVAPRTDTERVIAAIWQNVLNLEQVSIRANFFEAGGNSLSAMQVLSQLRQAFPIELSIRQFFTAQTLIEQAAVVGALLEEQAGIAQTRPTDNAPIQPLMTEADSIQVTQRDDPQALLSQLDEFSEQDVDSLLGRLLAEEES